MEQLRLARNQDTNVEVGKIKFNLNMLGWITKPNLLSFLFVF